MRKTFLSLSLSLFVLMCGLLQPAPTAAQERKGAISGHVTDASHAVLQGARVELRPAGASAVTDSGGEFTILGVPAGQYTLSVSYMGFETFSKEVTVAAGQAASVDAVLQVEKRSEIIEVRPEREVGEVGA